MFCILWDITPFWIWRTQNELNWVNFTAYIYIVVRYVTFIISVHGGQTALWYWMLLYVACRHHSWIFYMEWHAIQFQSISIPHMYIEAEYCAWSDMWYTSRTSVYLTCITKQNNVHGMTFDKFQNISIALMYIEREYIQVVTCDTVSEYLYISHVSWNNIYREWHVIEFQNICTSQMYNETEYCTRNDIW